MSFSDYYCVTCFFEYKDCECPCKGCGSTPANCMCSSDDSEDSEDSDECVCGMCWESYHDCTCSGIGCCDCPDCMEYSETCCCDLCTDYVDHCEYCPCVDCSGDKQNDCADRDHHDDCHCAFCCWYRKHAERLGPNKAKAKSRWTRKQARREERAKRTRMEEI